LTRVAAPLEHPLVEAARRLAKELLEPAAAQVDASTVPRSHLRAMADAGLLGIVAPAEVGGGGASAAVFREVTEVLAGADAATWFVQAQHHGEVVFGAVPAVEGGGLSVKTRLRTAALDAACTLFLLVQAQTAPARAATLDRWSARAANTASQPRA
jgi:alkylation response protein AidB-like acyl-CoA dehydrogenase